jgi:hypothetical protein
MFVRGRGISIEEPHGIPYESTRHFLRGYIERYGSIRIEPDQALVIPGPPEFLRWALTNGPGMADIHYYKDTNAIISYNHAAVNRWYDFLYFGAKVTTNDE